MRKNNLKLIDWNARSILSKKLELEMLAHQFQPDIICLTETWLKSTQRLDLHNFHVHRKDRDQGRGGGVAILVDTNLVPSPLVPELTLEEINDLYPSDYLGLTVHTSIVAMEIMVVYAPHNSNPEVETWQNL